MKLLIDAGADVDKCNVDYGTPPLHLAAENGNAMIAMLLIKAGAEVNLADTLDGKTPLWFAVDSHNMQMVSMLVRSGADVDIAPYDDDDIVADGDGRGYKVRGYAGAAEVSTVVDRTARRRAQVQCGRQGGVPHRRGSRGWVTGTISHWFRVPEWPKPLRAVRVKLDDSEDWSSPRRTMTTASGSSARDVD